MSEGQANILIGLPYYGKIDYLFFASLLGMLTNINSAEAKWTISGIEGTRISSNRNTLVKTAIDGGFTHLLFIDTDMVFPTDSLNRLLSHKKDIVCGTTTMRKEHDSRGHHQPGKYLGTALDKTPISTGLIEMLGVGSCFMLIKTDVFRKIGLPSYYEVPNYDIGDTEGEDLTFCKLARSSGYKIWMDVDLSKQLGHIGQKVFYIHQTSEL